VIDAIAESERTPRTPSRYRLLTRIASGGMGSVYLAVQHGAAGFRRVVAVKRAFPHLLEEASFRKLMASEIRLSSLVRHPNVVAVSDVEEDDGELSLVMEYVEGGALAELLKIDEVPLEIGLRIILDAAEGLEAVHTATDEDGRPLRLVHRDVSPQNILVGLDGVTRIADFGIAQGDPTSGSTVSGLLRGKPGYMAPEYIQTSRATPSTDLFALAVVAWELLTHRRLFRGASDVETLERVKAAEVPPPSVLAPGVPPAVDAVILRALAREPGDRFTSARAFGQALEAALLGASRIGSRAEVSAHVRRCVGTKLLERRALLREGTAAIASARASAPEIPVVVATEHRGATGSTRDERHRRREPGGLLAAFAAGAAALLLATIGGVTIHARATERVAPPRAFGLAATTRSPLPVEAPIMAPPPAATTASPPVVEPPHGVAPPSSQVPRAVARPAPQPIPSPASAAAPIPPPTSILADPPARAPMDPYGP